MKTKHRPGLLSACLTPVLFLALTQGSAQAQKNPWASAGDVAWGDAGVNGPGTSTRYCCPKRTG